MSVTELRNHLPAYLGKVNNGEEVAVTSRDKIIARLIPEVDECSAARLRLEASERIAWSEMWFHQPARLGRRSMVLLDTCDTRLQGAKRLTTAW